MTRPLRQIIALLTAMAFTIGGCGSIDEDGDRVGFWDFERDTDTDTDTEDETDTGQDYEDPCPENYLDPGGRCIRYVDFASANPECGFTWDTAFTDIQSGIESAFAAALIVGKCDVWVAQGTYRSYEWSPTNSIRLRPKVGVYGGFAGTEQLLLQRDIAAHPTIIDGREEGGPGRSYHVIQGASDSVLDGVIVQGGRADGEPPHHRGGGIYLNAAATRIRNCVFRENSAIDGGAAFIYAMSPSFVDTVFEDNGAQRGGAVYSINGHPLFRDVEFVGNRAETDGGAVLFERSFGGCGPRVIDTRFESNSAGEDGGAICNLGCIVEVEDGEFLSNTAWRDGGAVACFDGGVRVERGALLDNEAGRDGGGILAWRAEIEFNRGIIEGNRAARDAGGAYLLASTGNVFSSRLTGNRAGRDGGGVAVSHGSPAVVTTVITGNSAIRGGGMFNGTRAEPFVVNALLHGNRASLAGGAMYNADHSAPRITNSIVWRGFPDEIRDEIHADTEMRYSLVRGGYPGHNVLDLDPLLSKEGAWIEYAVEDDPGEEIWIEGDYRLTEGSPCIDFAEEGPAPIQDASGKPWSAVPGVGLPGVAVDMGPFDYTP